MKPTHIMNDPVFLREQIEKLQAELEDSTVAAMKTIAQCGKREKQLQDELAKKQLLLNGHIAANRQYEEENERLKAENVKLIGLLSMAKCPCCDGSGGFYDSYGNACQCQWCHEREQTLKGGEK